uniref:T-cell receptor alpha chain constant domain-containing protein n=1 Tax=Bos taurus TaxID=9913 RepID=A0AAA9TGI3_BOVIN
IQTYSYLKKCFRGKNLYNVKSNPTSAIDFDFQTIVSQVTKTMVFSSNSTVLDMGAIGSKSNWVLAWSKSTNVGHEDTFDQNFYPKKSSETGMNLNYQSLSVIRFCTLLPEAVGWFKLLMALWQLSS